MKADQVLEGIMGDLFALRWAHRADSACPMEPFVARLISPEDLDASTHTYVRYYALLSAPHNWILDPKRVLRT